VGDDALLNDGAEQIKGRLQLSLRVVGLDSCGCNGNEFPLCAHVVRRGDTGDVDVWI